MVILDFDLLKFSGEEVLKNMRLSGIATPVIIMSNSDDIRDCVKGLDIGADDYIGKPFEMEEVAHVFELYRNV